MQFHRATDCKEWTTLNTINTATACSTHTLNNANWCLIYAPGNVCPKLTTLSLHRHACGLSISPQCCKGADSILPPGVRLPGLRASFTTAASAAPSLRECKGLPASLWGDCDCSPHHRTSASDLCPWTHLLAPSRQDQPGDRRVCADPITASVQPHYRSLPPQGSHPPDGCIAIACEICFVMLFLHYHITD